MQNRLLNTDRGRGSVRTHPLPQSPVVTRNQNYLPHRRNLNTDITEDHQYTEETGKPAIPVLVTQIQAPRNHPNHLRMTIAIIDTDTPDDIEPETETGLTVHLMRVSIILLILIALHQATLIVIQIILFPSAPLLVSMCLQNCEEKLSKTNM